MDYKECKFYLNFGKCNHKDAPEPGRSSCIGKVACLAWEDDPSCMAVDPFKAGRESMLKEVEEWMNKNALACRSNTPSNKDEYLGFSKEDWQAFLKQRV